MPPRNPFFMIDNTNAFNPTLIGSQPCPLIDRHSRVYRAGVRVCEAWNIDIF